MINVLLLGKRCVMVVVIVGGRESGRWSECDLTDVERLVGRSC